MQTTAHYAPIVAIVAGVVGALIVCLLTYAYGFTPDDGQPSAVRRRRSIARVGQGLAGFSFGLAAIATVVGLVAASRASAAVEDRFQTLHGRVNDLVSTLHKLGEATDRLQTLLPPRGRLEFQASGAQSSVAPPAGPGVVQRPASRDAGWPQNASVAARDGDLARARVGSAQPQGEAPSLFPARVTQPVGRPVPRETAPSASGAIPLAPEAPPAPQFERVEPLPPPAGPTEAASVSMAPAPRIPAVVDVPRAPEVNAPAAAARPPSVESLAGFHRRERRERPERASLGERGDRIERRERADGPERIERVERPETPERPERVERPERRERQERVERVERRERGERPERVERRERGERIERPERRGRD